MVPLDFYYIGVPHRANRDTTIQGYEIPRGTVVVSNLWGAHHDPEVWHDPEVFKPERFLNKDGNVDLPKEWIPFSIGKVFVFSTKNIFICIHINLST